MGKPAKRGEDMDRDRFEKQLSFILEADKEKTILRQTRLSDGSRYENDAEHAWHMAIMIYLLREYSSEEIDTGKAMMMALIHDIVEIDAGDTYAYDEENLKTQKEREDRAAERIFGLLPENQAAEMKALFREFEEFATPEARFARVMDNFQPLLLNNANGGADWRLHNVRWSQVNHRQAESACGSEFINKYANILVDKNVELGNIINDKDL